MEWLIYALLSAFFAALTAILAKIGVEGINSNLATGIRTVVILLFAWGIVWWQGAGKGLGQVSSRTWIFLILSGIATGMSWLFYFRALQLGKAAQVAPIDKLSLILTIALAGVFLKEKVSWQIAIGGVLMSVGAVLVAIA